MPDFVSRSVFKSCVLSKNTGRQPWNRNSPNPSPIYSHPNALSTRPRQCQPRGFETSQCQSAPPRLLVSYGCSAAPDLAVTAHPSDDGIRNFGGGVVTFPTLHSNPETTRAPPPLPTFLPCLCLPLHPPLPPCPPFLRSTHPSCPPPQSCHTTCRLAQVLRLARDLSLREASPSRTARAHQMKGT